MESGKKIIAAILIIMIRMTAYAAVAPSDIPTIEALIDAHKKMKKAEDLAVLELTAIAETHSFTQKAAAKYNETRKMLNQRLADVGSVITLTSSLTSLVLQLKNLTESYEDFTKTTYKNAKRHPLLLAIYTNANIKIADEIKHISKSCIDYAGFQTNILKSTMEEKRQILSFISAHIASVQRIINRASLMCRSMLTVGVQEYHVWELINSTTNQKIMNKVIGKWTGDAG